MVTNLRRSEFPCRYTPMNAVTTPCTNSLYSGRSLVGSVLQKCISLHAMGREVHVAMTTIL